MAVKLRDGGYWYTHASGRMEQLEMDGFRAYAKMSMPMPSKLELAEAQGMERSEPRPRNPSGAVPARPSTQQGNGPQVVGPGSQPPLQGNGGLVDPRPRIYALIEFSTDKAAADFRAYYAQFLSRNIVQCFSDTKLSRRFLCVCVSDEGCKEFEGRSSYFGATSRRIEPVTLPSAQYQSMP